MLRTFQVLRRSSRAKKIVKKQFSLELHTLVPVKLAYATYENIRASGDPAAPLIIVHGLFGSKSNWNSLCKVFQQKTNPQRKIVAVDARNHGDSPHSEQHNYAYMAADLKTLLDDLGIKKATLMGHSMGGRAVALFALKYPELIEKLIVVDISIFMTSPGLSAMPELFEVMERVRLPQDIPMSQCRTSVDAQLAAKIKSKDLRAFLMTNLVRNTDGSFKWRINIPSLISNFNNIGRFPEVHNLQYRGPTLFLGGGDSDYIP